MEGAPLLVLSRAHVSVCMNSVSGAGGDLDR